MSISYFTRWINGTELFVNKPRCSQALYQCWRLWCTETFYGAKDTLWSASSHPINMYTDINAEMVISMKSTYSKKVIRDIETEQLFRLLVCQCPADTTRQCESVGSVREGSILILRIHHKSKTSRMERLELLLPYIFFFIFVILWTCKQFLCLLICNYKTFRQWSPMIGLSNLLSEGELQSTPALACNRCKSETEPQRRTNFQLVRKKTISGYR